jgi:hypothetical protein
MSPTKKSSRRSPFGRIEADERRVVEIESGMTGFQSGFRERRRRDSVTKLADNLICSLTLFTMCYFDESRDLQTVRVRMHQLLFFQTLL